jgi:hypothetical protein
MQKMRKESSKYSEGKNVKMTPEELEIAYRIAQKFHETYERLAPAYGYRTRAISAVPWEDVPKENKLLMVGVVASLLDTGVIKSNGETS